jgi:large subunit ribosomal protein L10
VARVFEDFVKENEDLVVKGLGVSGDFVEASELKRIAGLPTKDQAIVFLNEIFEYSCHRTWVFL